MSKLVFICPKCKSETLSVEDGDSALKEGVSDPRLTKCLKQLMTKFKMEKYCFWRCEKCNVYYQTDLNRTIIAECPSTVS